MTNELLDRRRFLLAAAGTAAAGVLHAQQSFAAPALPVPSLARLAAEKGLFFASSLPFFAFNLPDQPADLPKAPSEIAKIYLRECTGFVGDSKNDEIMRPDGRLDWTRPERVFKFAQSANRPLIWHTLFWNRASRHIASIKDRKDGIAALRSWVQGFLTHWGNYPIHSIQVVNELHFPWSKHKWGYGTAAPEGGPHPWLSAIGDEAPELAFRFASEVAEPGTELILNEHTWTLTNGNWGAYDRNRKNILTTLKRWLDARVPIHGLGLQLHLTPGFTPIRAPLLPGSGDYIDPSVQVAFLDEVAALGLKIHLTEFDCTDIYLAGKPLEERRETCAGYARQFLPPLLAHKAVHSFQLAIMSDNPHDSYLAGDSIWDQADARWGDKPVAPRPREAMPYDADLQPKPLRAAIAEALASTPGRA